MGHEDGSHFDLSYAHAQNQTGQRTAPGHDSQRPDPAFAGAAFQGQEGGIVTHNQPGETPRKTGDS